MPINRSWLCALVGIIISASNIYANRAAQLDQEIKNLEARLQEKVHEYNKIIQKQSIDGKATAYDDDPNTSLPHHHDNNKHHTSIEDRLKNLENRVRITENQLTLENDRHGNKDLNTASIEGSHEIPKSNLPGTQGLGQYQQAFQVYKKMQCAQESGDKSRVNELGNIALDNFEEFLHTYPNDSLTAQCLIHIGQIHLTLEHFESALKAFDRALKRVSDNTHKTDALLGMGQVHKSQGEKEKVRTIMNRLQDLKLDKHLTFEQKEIYHGLEIDETKVDNKKSSKQNDPKTTLLSPKK